MTKEPDYFDEPITASREGFSVGFFILAIIVVIAVGGFYLFRYLNPAYEEVRRDTFMESTAHIQGTIRNITNYRTEYISSENEEHRAALRDMIIQETNEIKEEDIPDYLLRWIRDEIQKTNPRTGQ